MPLLQVRDCPEPLYDELKRCAERERRTIAQQNLVILEEYFYGHRNDVCSESAIDMGPLPEFNKKRRMEAFKRIEELGPLEIPEGFPDAATLIREDRDR